MDIPSSSSRKSSNKLDETGPKKRKANKDDPSEPERKKQRVLYSVDAYESSTDEDECNDRQHFQPQATIKTEPDVPENLVETLNAALADSKRLHGDLDRMQGELSVATKTNESNTQSLRSAINEITRLQRKLNTVTKHRDRLKSRLTSLKVETEEYKRSSEEALAETASVKQELEDTKSELEEYRQRIKVLEEEKRLRAPVADAASMIRARFLEHAKRIMQLKRETYNAAVVESGNRIAHEPNFTLDLRLFQSGLFTLEANADMHRCFQALYQIAPEIVPATYPHLFERARMSRALIEMIPAQPQPLGREERLLRRDLWNEYRDIFQDFDGVCEACYDSWSDPEKLEEFEGNLDYIDAVTRMERLAQEIKVLEQGPRHP